MDKYQAVSFVGILQITYILGVIILAGIFKNWWLLFLIIIASSEDCEERILNSTSRRGER